ncbi:MAG TPA: SLC13 family permease, partial [Chloroflexota bacterium]|nr:SLC13 family permease [Chloroflexota bacterium]
GIFVMAGALHQTGVSETIGSWIGRLAGGSLTRAIAVIMPSVAALSAFTHHVTTTAIMVPVTLNLSRERGVPASKLMMPLSFAASLGTAITIIGAPAFLVASKTLTDAGRPPLGIFSISPVGIAISIAGTLFILVLGRFLLPTRQGAEDSSGRFKLDDYFTELTILPDSPFLGKTWAEVQEDQSYKFTITGWLRSGRQIQPPYGENTFRQGDVLLVRASPEDIIAFREEKGLELHPVAKYQHELPDDGIEGGEVDEVEVSEQLVQVVVAPRSEFVGRTLGEIDFRRRFGAIAVSIWRKQGWLREEMSKIRLQGGDVLVVMGSENALGRVASERGFLMMVPFQGEARRSRKAVTAAGIMLAAVLLTAFNVVTLEIAALAGAVAMVLSRCLSARQAYRAIDQRIFVFIAGAIPLGTAMKSTGTADLIAQWLQNAVGGWSPFMICVAIYIVVAAITQFMSDAATTAIFAPVAAALAQALGHAPEPYVITTAMSAVTAFLTPIGHHGNLLIYGPGGYRFWDFVRVGAPLTVVVAVVIAFLAPIVWPIANVG